MIHCSEFLATQNKQAFWSLVNDVKSFDSFTPDARMKKQKKIMWIEFEVFALFFFKLVQYKIIMINY